MKRRTPDPQPLSEILPGLMRSIRGTGRGKLERIRSAWSAVVGARVAGRSRVVGFVDGCLRVEVESAALKHDLATFRARGLLEELRVRLPELAIRELRFGVGRRPRS